MDTDRRIASRELQPLLPDPYRQHNHFDRLATLAEVTHSDKVLEEFRSELAGTIYFNVLNWREDDSRELALDRCKQLLRLLSELIYMSYDRQAILSFLNEMEDLANTLNTAIAKEVRGVWLKEFLERDRFKR